jgi:RimJ/RimL family protein N-acetyltransferase
VARVETQLVEPATPGDEIIFLRPLTREDAAVHLAGEDEAIARWLSGGASTPATVSNYIARCQQNWQTGGPLRAFGIFSRRTGQLIGSIEANLTPPPPLTSGQVNVSYSVFPAWRGQEIALRAIQLMVDYLRNTTDAREVVIRIAAENGPSLRVLEKSGYPFAGFIDEPNGRMAHYAINLLSES